MVTSWYHDCGDDDHRAEAAADAEDDVAAADIVGGPRADTLFWFDEAVFEDTTLLLGDEGRDPHLYTPTPAARCLQQVESTFPMEEESARISPRSEDQDHRADADEAAEPKHQVQEEVKTVAFVDVPTVPEQRRNNNVQFVTSPENVSFQGNILRYSASYSDISSIQVDDI
jgi:hypothetical protein